MHTPVCKCYAHIEGIDYGETYARVARMEEIRLIIAYACSKRIKVYQMDVKPSFLKGKLEEEVYMEQTEGFQLSEAENHVYMLKKSLYGTGLLIIAYACSKRIKVYQIDVKPSFLNGKLEEEVYMEQTEGFQLSEAENHVYMLKKSLYGIE